MAKRSNRSKIQFQSEPKMKAWLETKALEKSHVLGVNVSAPHIVRALIKREMEKDKQLGKIWDD